LPTAIFYWVGIVISSTATAVGNQLALSTIIAAAIIIAATTLAVAVATASTSPTAAAALCGTAVGQFFDNVNVFETISGAYGRFL
jgi:fucose permease